MLGETEILGQMKQSYQKAKEEGKTQKYLNRLFEKVFKVQNSYAQKQALAGGKSV